MSAAYNEQKDKKTNHGHLLARSFSGSQGESTTLVDDEGVVIDVEAFSGKTQTDTAAIALRTTFRQWGAIGIKLRLIFSCHIVHTDGAMLGFGGTSGIAATKARCGLRLKATAILLMVRAYALELTIVGPVSTVAAAGTRTAVVAGFGSGLTRTAHGGVEPEAAVVGSKIAKFVGLTVIGRAAGCLACHFGASCFGNQSRVGTFTGVASVGRIEHFSRLANLVFRKAFAIDAWPAIQIIAWVR